jgi:hypothetical protein
MAEPWAVEEREAARRLLKMFALQDDVRHCL